MKWRVWLSCAVLLSATTLARPADSSTLCSRAGSSPKSLNDIVRNGIGDPDGGSDRDGEIRTQFVYQAAATASGSRRLERTNQTRMLSRFHELLLRLSEVLRRE